MRIALPAAIDAAAVAARDPAAAIVALDGETMGTTWRVLFACPPRLGVAALHARIVARLDGLVAEMSHWQPGSLLSRFNRSPAGSWTALPPDFASVIAAGLRIAEASDGAFDPALGRLVDLWGFGPPGPAAPPSPDDVASARAASGWRRLAFDAGARRLRQPGGLALDLSGIAKGHAVDALADLLAAAGVRHCLVEVGGELAGRGVRPDGEPWWVDLETPPGTTPAPLRIGLHQLAVATSGNYRRGDHNLDASTGRPAGNGVASVSVVDTSAMIADAWASAVAVLEPEAGIDLARRQGLAARIIMQSDERTAERLSPALAAMIEA